LWYKYSVFFLAWHKNKPNINKGEKGHGNIFRHQSCTDRQTDRQTELGLIRNIINAEGRSDFSGRFFLLRKINIFKFKGGDMKKIILVLVAVLLLISVNLYAQEEQSVERPQQADAADSKAAVNQDDTPVHSKDKSAAAAPTVTADAVSTASAIEASSALTVSEDTGGALSDSNTMPVNVTSAGNIGAAVTSIPIIVPPGRKGMEPKLSLNYNSNTSNGWPGIGWTLDMGAIQRSTKRGVNYSANDYMVTVNGSTSELIARGDWGVNYYGVKIEWAFLKYYYDSALTGGWIVTTKDGTKYYYGTTADSRQDDPANISRIFKWCLTRVEATNGNYMTLTYSKSNGEIYLSRIDYTGNSTSGATLSPGYSVRFYNESRVDAPPMYTTNFSTKMTYRLKTIDILYGSTRVRTYRLLYTAGGTTSRSLLSSVQQYGSDAVLDATWNVLSGTALPAISMVYQTEADGTFGNFINTTHSTTGYDPPWKFNFADVNGDGMADAIANKIGNSTGATVRVALSNGDGYYGSLQETVLASSGYNASWKFTFTDVNGDGMADAIAYQIGNSTGATVRVALSNGDGYYGSLQETVLASSGYNASWKFTFTDVNGDGMADAIAYQIGNSTGATVRVALSNGDGYYGSLQETIFATTGYAPPWSFAFADINGDGRNDAIACFIGDPNGTGTILRVALSKGDGTFASFIETKHATSGYPPPWQFAFADINGDSRVDAIAVYIGDDTNPVGTRLRVALSIGSGQFRGFVETKHATSGYGTPWKFAFADINGDLKSDAVAYYIGSGSSGGTRLRTAISNGSTGDNLLTSISNGMGGTTTLQYRPSSAYDNNHLPFAVQTLSSVTMNDGNGISSTTTYYYEGGYFDNAEREFRGFEYVKASTPNAYTATWFMGCYPTPYDAIWKGLPYYQITKDSSGNKYTETYNLHDYTTPYAGVNFPYLERTDDYVYDGTSTARHTAGASFEYDAYGNITRKYLWGDASITGDERDEYTEYYLDGEVGSYLVALPKRTYVLDSSAVMKAQSWFTYDPKGNLLTKTDWLDGGTNPVTTYTYTPVGNVWSIKDANNNLTNITYDTTTRIFPTNITNALSQAVNKTYDYKFGKELTIVDPNANTTTYSYDVFGRPAKVTSPNDTTSTYGTITYYYLNFGTVGSQKVVTYATEQSGTGNYIWSEKYFDGLGRTIKTRTEGPDSKVIVTQKNYNNRGLVDTESLPYFEGLETGRWKTYQYDPIGRPTRTDYPDGTYTTTAYMKGIFTYIDPKGHKKVEEKDSYGRTIKIDEYTGVSPSYTLYATTTYNYDVLGNLTKVTDAQNNQTLINYDTLSRKISMTDPNMGYWMYQYDPNGNLISQTDAKSQTILFTYDALNRITKKDYSAGTDILYTYDETFSTYPKGRLTTLTDASGTAKFYYDKLGRTVKIIKTVDSVNYTTETAYDVLNRTDTVTYPDNTVIKYEYDTGGNLYRAKDNSTGLAYATYVNYNALGQFGRTDYGNGVNTTYQYWPQNDRLFSITTSKQSTGFMNISYDYDNAGNITGITDYLDSTKTRIYGYDDLDRLTSTTSTSYGGTLTWQYDKIGNMTYNSRYGAYAYNDPAHVHAVTQAGADTYTYDANGNMISGAGRTLTYDYDNRATSIVKSGAATISVYDAGGQRVKKVIPGATTVYIGQLYECTGGICTKYIFGGSDRIVSIEGTNTRYYHTDHLGSSSVITKEDGTSVQAIYYYPYGEIHSNIGIDVTRYKFTGQEWDAETELYYYGARYYDPKLARFISADTIVPMPFYPQSLNRYAYCINNPIVLRDLDGHSGEWYDGGDLDFLFNSDSGSNNGSDNFWNWGSGGGSSSGGSGYSGSNNMPYYIFRNSPSVISTSSNSYRSNSTSSSTSSVGIGGGGGASVTSVIGGGGTMYAANTNQNNGQTPYDFKDGGNINGGGLEASANVSQMAYEQALTYVGDKSYSGKCNQFPISVYNDIGHPLTGYQLAGGYQNFPELAVTINPVPGDVAQYLKSAGAPYDHVAIYAGNNQIITTTRATSSTHGAITLYDIDKFRSGQPFRYLHYTGGP
jgi:RHS repeat-associated protein